MYQFELADPVGGVIEEYGKLSHPDSYTLIQK